MFRELYLQSLYRKLRAIFNLLQWLRWCLNGTTGKLQKIWAGQDFETSAQVLNIRGRYHPDPTSRNRTDDFVATHECFVHPDFILKRIVSLYAVSPTEAVFVEVPRDVDLYNCNESPLFYIRQYSEAVKIIRMPISSFHRVADAIGDPDDKTVVFLHFLARSGSTLLLQILARLQGDHGAISISEASPDSQLVSEVGKYTTQEYKKMFQSTFRLICKEPATLITMKMSDTNSLKLAPMVQELFPKFYQLFSYRSPLPMNRSKVITYSQYHPFQLFDFVQRRPRLARLLGVPRDDMVRDYYGEKHYQRILPICVDFTMYMTVCIHSAVQIDAYRTHYNNGVRIRGVRYEDLMSDDSEAALLGILHHIGLAQFKSEIPNMLRAKETDSHASGLMACRRTAKTDLISAALIPVGPDMADHTARVDTYCTQLGLPPLSRSHLLCGTITEVTQDHGI